MRTAKTASKKKVVRKTVKKKKATTGRPVLKDMGPFDLIVVESPSKAKTIKRYLGRGFQVVASNGHIKDLPKSKLGVDVDNNFKTDLIPISGKNDKVARIQQLAKKANKIYLAPDMDREGEAIAFHVREEISRKKDVYRVVFNAVTKNRVKEAIEHPSKLNQNMYDSQKTRRILDRLVGYKISPILWEKVQRGISAGRVQSVSLRLIVEREEEIRAFVPEQWFSITGEMEKSKIVFKINYYGEKADKKQELTDKELVEKIVADVKGQPFEIVSIKKNERKQSPTPPFTTSKLQQEAAHKLGFTAKRTMMIAQKLYEGIPLTKHGMQGLITYMRTDSVRTEPGFIQTVREFIEKNYGKNFLPNVPTIYKKKKNSSKVQDAHEAIRPTDLAFTPKEVRGDLEPDQQKLYELIWNKFTASQMSQAIIDQTQVTLNSKGHFFRANGSNIKFLGFRKVYLEGIPEGKIKGGDFNKILPKLSEGEILYATQDPQAMEHWTTPPPRYNEASLVKDLEEQGIGRPSTYASIISNIQDRGYVEKIENKFTPTELGIVVCRMLIGSFPEIMDVKFTAKMETLLDLIEDGEKKWKSVLKDFWTSFEVALGKAKEEMKNLKKQSIPTGVACLKCQKGEYQIKWGRNGQFLSCSHYPECNSTQDFKKDLDGGIHIIPKKYFYENCPQCHKRLEEKKGRYGRFVRCEDYPQCETTLPYTLPILCPDCKVGKFAERQSRFGKTFYACTQYPDCQNSLWTAPYNFPCSSCGYPIMVYRETKREGRQLQCPKCRHKVDWDETPFAVAESASPQTPLSASKVS